MNVPRIAFGLGVAALAASCVLSLGGGAQEPGVLIPDQTTMVWHGPSELDKKPAKVRFTLHNTGDAPVRILSVEAGCGCTTPKVSRDNIPGGGLGYVDVESLFFPVGERQTSIVLNTDSPVTPHLRLRLHMIGVGKPPFLLKVTNDLSYMGVFDPSDARELVVHTIETGSQDEKPRFDHVPSVLRIEPAGMTEEPYVLPGTIHREYRFKVSFASPPVPRGTYSEEFFVIDPWNETRREGITLLAQFFPPIRVAPPLVILRPDPEDGGAGGEARFMIIAREPMSGLQAKVEEGDSRLVAVTPSELPQPTRTASFQVRVVSKDAPESDIKAHIVITCAPDQRIVVPVVLKAGGGS